MVPFGALLLPIVLSAALVFIVSSMVHMVLRYHASDYHKLPNEDAVRAALQAAKPEPGQYVIPHASNMKEMQTPEMKQKYAEGPVAMLSLKAPGEHRMNACLAQWFVFTLVISAMVAYVAAHAIPPGTPYLSVFRIAGTVAWLGYAGGQLPAAIWMGKPWSVAWKDVFDGLLYGLVTGGAFGWLWPR